MYPEHAAEGDVAIYQFTTSSAVAGYLAEHGLPLIIDFHNFTGPEYFAGWEPDSVRRAARAAEELALLAPRAVLGLAKSPFSERGLRRAGCRRTAVVPVLADYGRVDVVSRPPGGGASSTGSAAGGGADILFVGRIVPSKAQHELVKALWAYRRLYDPQARLHLVGGTSSFEYNKALQVYVDDLGLAERRADHRRGVRRVARRPLRRRRRLPLPLRPRGIRRPAAGGHGGRCSRRDPRCRRRRRDGGGRRAGAGRPPIPSYVAAALHRVCTDDAPARHADRRGPRRAAELPGARVAARIVDAVAGVVAR